MDWWKNFSYLNHIKHKDGYRYIREDHWNVLVRIAEQAQRGHDDLASRLEAAGLEYEEVIRERDEWKREAQTQAELYRERCRERDEARRQLELITSYRVRHREAIRKANAEREDARTVARKIVEACKDASHTGYAELLRQNPWLNEDD